MGSSRTVDAEESKDDWRQIATRYDKLARNFLAATNPVGSLYWIKL